MLQIKICNVFSASRDCFILSQPMKMSATFNDEQQKGEMRLFTQKLLILVLVTLFTVEPVLVHAAIGTPQLNFGPHDYTQNLPPQLRSLFAKLDGASETDFPEASEEDGFSFLNQKIRVEADGRTQTYDVAMPPQSPAIGDFHKEVSIEFNPSTRTLSLVLEGKTRYFHDFENLDVATFARTSEHLVIVEKSGQVHHIDMGFAATQAFRAPVPMIRLVQLPKNLIEGELTSAFMTVGLKPKELWPDALAPDKFTEKGERYYDAGDFLISNDSHTVAILDRDVMRTQIETAQTILEVLAALISPNPEKLNLALRQVPKLKQSLPKLSALERDVVRSVSYDWMKQLVRRSQTNESAVQERRDKVTKPQWDSRYQNVVEQANRELATYAEAQNAYESAMQKVRAILDTDRPSRDSLEQGLANEDLSPIWQKLTERERQPSLRSRVRKSVSNRALQIMKLSLAGGGAVLAAKGLLDGNGPAWAIATASYMYINYWPETLKDAVYRKTLFKSWLMIGSFVPAVYAIGALASRTIFKGWSPQKSTAKMGMVIYGITSLPFFHYVADFARLSNVVYSLQKGINPLKKIIPDPESGVRPFRAGLTNPFLAKPDRVDQVSERRRELDKVATENERTESLAFALAAMTFAVDAETDPATLMFLASRNGLDAEVLTKLSEDTNMQGEWLRIARELKDVLQEATTLRGRSLESLGRNAVMQAITLASNAAKKIKAIQNKSTTRKIILDLKQSWNLLATRVKKISGNFGVEESKSLLKKEPSKFWPKQYFRQFVWDFELTMGQMGTYGARADFAHPQHLAATTSGIGNTNPAYLVDVVEDLRINNVNNPATMALVFQNDSDSRDTIFGPAQETTLEGEDRVDRLTSGIWRWLKNTSDLTNTGLRDIYFTDLIKGTQTLQAVMFFSTLSRIVIADQPMVDALLATIYVWIWYRWQYNWPWAIGTRGNEMYENEIEKHRREFMDLKIDLDQALKLDNTKAAEEAYVRLLKYAQQRDPDLPPFLSNWEGQLQARSEFLMNHLLKKPVVPTEANGKVLKGITAFMSVFTTLLASDLLADSFNLYTVSEWFDKIALVTGLSTAIYIGVHVGERSVLPKLIEKWKSFREPYSKSTSIMSCYRSLK